MTYFIFKSYRRDETWLEKFANAFNYGKSICNMFEWDRALIEVIRVKTHFGEWFSKNGLIKIFYMRVGRKFVVDEMKLSQASSNC